MRPERAESAKPENASEFKVAAEGFQSPSADEETAEGKSIFLFADGTGNSSARLFKTNVWRMYEAVDLGLASPGKHVQIAYYDNGVGTSNFRPLKMLGGIFGIGLAANVRRLYDFLCRNYQPGDRIYAFGFSRGAFTIRVLVGLITSQGVLHTNGEAALAYQTRSVYREFRRQFLPNRRPAQWLVKALRALRDGFVAVKQTIMRQQRYRDLPRRHTDVEFVGVWDTVAAYGGPITELTRGIDDWVWPLSMPHYGLSAKVAKARHALALDEERDAFQPLLWDEVREADLVTAGEMVFETDAAGKEITSQRTVSPERLKQVWFAGVHSDVGGGYPDESLSYNSLLWMMDELGPDVDLLPSFVQRARDLANPYGPIHDSRAGVAGYYRYQPRKIAAILDPPRVSTLSLRDPEVGRGGRHGLLRCVCVHDSAVARIISGIDNYAPSALPASFKIEHTSGPNATPCLTAKQLQTLASAEPKQPLREAHQENAWNLVLGRRLLYFATLGFTLILLGLPFLDGAKEFERICGDDRCFADWMVDKGLFFIPRGTREFLEPWTQTPIVVLILVSLIFGAMALGKRGELRFRDRVRAVWRDYLNGTLSDTVPPSRVRRIRNSAAYQRVFHFIKWRLLPAVLGLLTLAALVYAVTVVLTQTLYAFAEQRNVFCTDREQGAQPPPGEGVELSTAETCTALRTSVVQEHAYKLRLTVTDEWKDGGLEAVPAGGVGERPAYMKLFAPLRRVTRADWMEPLTEIRQHQPDERWRRWLTPLLGPRVDIRVARFKPVGGKDYVADFCPVRSGDLYLMVNEAAPLLTPFFYWNNEGTAMVTVEALGTPCDPRHSG